VQLSVLRHGILCGVYNHYHPDKESIGQTLKIPV